MLPGLAPKGQRAKGGVREFVVHNLGWADWSPGCFLPSEVIGSQGTVLSLLLWSPALDWPCSWHFLPHFPQAAGNSMLGVCQWEATVCCSKLLLPAVCESSSSREQGLMPSTKNGFHQRCVMRLYSGGCWTKGQKGGESWPQWQMESGPGRMSSAFFNMPFPF